ncbi:MAG: sugar transferase [Pseudomonadota bacterium]
MFSRYAVSSPIKRALDIVGALALLVLMGPILICAAAAVLAVDGGPVVYRHRRVGRDGERFDCLKLRSMRRDADAALRRILANDPAARAEWEAYRKLRRDPRVLPLIGMLLRRTSLDELPQLFNVLWGRMSLVGPRPVTVEELERYGEVRAHYLAVRPGLSGRWQVSGRSDISFGARTQIDRRYVETATLGADLWILLMTPLAVLFGRGSA